MLRSGVVRKNCTYMESWQSYKCFGLNYRMMVIESLDADTETRRLSPVAVLGDGFVDLINGLVLIQFHCLLWVWGSEWSVCGFRSSGSRLVRRLHLSEASVSVPQHSDRRPRL